MCKKKMKFKVNDQITEGHGSYVVTGATPEHTSEECKLGPHGAYYTLTGCGYIVRYITEEEAQNGWELA